MKTFRDLRETGPRAAYGNAHLRGRVNKQLVWEFKQSFVKVVVNRIVHLQECPLIDNNGQIEVSSLGWVHYIVLLGMTRYQYSCNASLHPGV